MSELYSSAILGLGAVSCYGDLVQDLATAVENKDPAPLTLAPINYRKKNIEAQAYLAPKFKLLFPLSSAMERRLGRLARMSFQALLRAMDEANFEIKEASRVGIIIGTAHGASSLIERFSKRITLESIKSASPILFSNSVHNSVSSFIAQSLGINGPSTTIVCKELTTAAAIERANAWINEDLVEHVLLAIGDEHYTKLHVYNNYSLKPTNPKNYNPLIQGQPVIGEGVLGMVLSKVTKKGSHQRIQGRTYSSTKEFNKPKNVIVDYKAGFAAHEQARKLFIDCAVACYGKNYGSFTTGGALDTAIATYGLREGKQYGSTARHPEIKTLDSTLTQVDNIHLVQISDHGEIGHVCIQN